MSELVLLDYHPLSLNPVPRLRCWHDLELGDVVHIQAVRDTDTDLWEYRILLVRTINEVEPHVEKETVIGTWLDIHHEACQIGLMVNGHTMPIGRIGPGLPGV